MEQTSGKILGIDYGSKRVGLAISDESQTLARELAIWSPKEFWEKILDLVEKEQIQRVIIGLPLNMSGQDSDTTMYARQFAEKLKKQTEVAVELMDERLSSVMAAGMPGGHENVDSLAAQIILQNYLDKQSNRNQN
jgi:putative Holliday junction resolvase